MSELNDEGRSLFDAARAGYEPSAEDRKRVLNGVLVRAGVVVGVTSVSSASAAAGAPLAGVAGSSSIAGLAFKAALWLAIGGSLGVGGYAISRVHSSRPSAVAASTQIRARSTGAIGPSGSAQGSPRAVVTSNSELLGPRQSAEVSRPNTSRPTRALSESSPLSPAFPASSRNHNGAAPRTTTFAGASAIVAFPSEAPSKPTQAPAPSASGLALSVEARALAEVQRALREGRNAQALRLVEEQRQQFARGELQPERDAAQIVALCAVGRVADARAAARNFLSNSPRSPFAARIRASCAGQ